MKKADMLDALLERFKRMELRIDAKKEGSTTLGYVAGWLDAIESLVDAEKKKQDERKELLERLKQSGARVNAKGFYDTAEDIEKDLAEIEARIFVVPPDAEITPDDEYDDGGGDDRATD